MSSGAHWVKRKGRQEPTLLTFLQALPGKRVKLELQNDTLVEGTVESVSDQSDFALTGKAPGSQACCS